MEPQDPKAPQLPKKKRVRRRAPPYTLVWSEPVRCHPRITTSDVLKLRKKVMSLIELAEAALRDDPMIYKLGMTAAEVDDIVWAKFQVGKHWFFLELRHNGIREYVVNLADPPSPGDIPPPPRDLRNGADNDGAPPARGDEQPHKKNGDGTQSALIVASVARREITVLFRLTRRKLSRGLEVYKANARAGLSRASQHLREIYRNVSYKTRIAATSLRTVLRRFASTIAVRGISFTRLRQLPAQQVSFEARLEPRCVGQHSGLQILVYSWIRDEPPPVDWSADLFGVLPIDWAANLFGVLPEEERAFT